MNFVKIFRVAFFVLICGILVACGGGSASSPQSEAATPTPVPGTGSSPQPVTGSPSLPPQPNPDPISPPVIESLLPSGSDSERFKIWLAPFVPNANFPPEIKQLVYGKTNNLPQIRANSFGELVFSIPGTDLAYRFQPKNAEYLNAVTTPNSNLRNVYIPTGEFFSFSVQNINLHCGSSAALFVHELSTDSNNNITTAAIDILMNCSGNPKDYLRGGIRYNSQVALLADKTFGPTLAEKAVIQGRAITLYGGLIYHTLDSWSKPLRYRWTNESGPALDLSSCDQASVCQTYSPRLTGATETSVIRLEVISDGKTLSLPVPIRIQDNISRQSRLELKGSGFVARAGAVTLTDSDLNFDFPKVEIGGATALQNDKAMKVDWSGLERVSGSYSSGSIGISTSTVLAPASFVTPISSALPGFSVTSNGAGGPSQTDVNLAILNRNRQDFSDVTTVALDFASRACALDSCEDDATYGLLWINHLPVNPPVVELTGPSVLNRGTSQVASCSNRASSPSGNRVVHLYRLKGPAIDVSLNADGSFLIFTPPDAPVNSQIVISCEIVDSRSNVGVDIKTFTIN